jgi:hypothetical protein
MSNPKTDMTRVPSWGVELAGPFRPTSIVCEHPVPPGGRVAWAGLEELSFLRRDKCIDHTRDTPSQRGGKVEGIASACLGNHL